MILVRRNATLNNMNRRQALGSMAAVGCLWRGAETCAFSESHGAAYEPWRQEFADSCLHCALRAATLAASPHNTQPWQFHFTDNRIELSADASRSLGAIDPLRREQHIGIGCALENLVVAAEGAGYAVSDIDYDNQWGTERIASVQFVSCASRESMLSRAIPHRHTNRGPYQSGRTVEASLFDQMCRLNTEPQRIHVKLWLESSRQIKNLIIAAAEAVVADREQSRESATWFRPTAAAIALHRDGITIEAQGLSPFATAIAKLLPAPSDSFVNQVFLRNTRDVYCGPGAVFGTIAVKEPGSKWSRVQVGRLWQRMHLWATANGIAMQPINQIHERIDREATGSAVTTFASDLDNLLNAPGWHGIFSFRMGYARRRALPSPRRDLAACLI